MVRFLFPWVLALLPFLWLLVYLLYRRRSPPTRNIAGLWLWRRALGQGQSRRRWDLRLALLLSASGLALAALAQPELAAAKAGLLVVVVDASASMAATDVAPNRLGQAKTLARPWLASSPKAVLVRAGDEPEAFGPAPGRALLPALQGLKAGDKGAGLEAALALGSRLLPGARTLIISDSPDPPASDGYLNVAAGGANAGITAVAPGFLALANSGPAPYSGEVLVNGRRYSVKVPSSGFATLEVPEDTFEARLIAQDALAQDNQASFKRQSVRVKLEDGSPALERLLLLLGAVPGNSGVIAFSNQPPEQDPKIFTVYFAREGTKEALVVDAERTLPYLRGVELVGYNLSIPPRPPEGWRPLIAGAGGVTLAWYHPQGLYLPRLESLQDLPAFPVLVYNLVAPYSQVRQGLLSAEETLLPRPSPSRPLAPTDIYPLAPWLALLAALILLLEWWLFSRHKELMDTREAAGQVSRANGADKAELGGKGRPRGLQ